MWFLIKLLLAFVLIQTHGFCASKLSVLEPLVTTVLKRAYTTAVKHDGWAPKHSFHSLNRSSTPPIQSYIFTGQKRFFSDQRGTKTVKIGNPCIDGIFQYGFDSTTALKGFLNTVLDFEGKKSIRSIEYLNKDLPSSDRFGYHFTVDVRCRTEEGHHFLIEMQNDFRDDYHMKSLIEYARMLSRLDTTQSHEDQERRSQRNKNDTSKFWKGIEGIYAIVITNKGFSSSQMKKFYPEEPLMEPSLVNRYELRHTEKLGRRYGDIPSQIVLVMLDNMNKSQENLSSSIERWAYVFKDSSMRSGSNKKIQETKEIIDPELLAGGDQAISEFIDRVNMDKLPLEVRERYMSAIRDYNDCILDIREKGHKDGILKAIRAMKKRNVPDAEIAKVSSELGLTEADLSELTGED